MEVYRIISKIICPQSLVLNVSVCPPFMYEHAYVICMNRNELIHEKTFMLTLSVVGGDH